MTRLECVGLKVLPQPKDVMVRSFRFMGIDLPCFVRNGLLFSGPYKEPLRGIGGRRTPRCVRGFFQELYNLAIRDFVVAIEFLS